MSLVQSVTNVAVHSAVHVEEDHPEVIAIDEFRPATIEPAIVLKKQARMPLHRQALRLFA